MNEYIPYFFKMGETGIWILILWTGLKRVEKKTIEIEDRFEKSFNEMRKSFMKAHDDVIGEVKTMSSSLQSVEKTMISQSKDLDSGKERFLSIEKKIEKMDNEFLLIKLNMVRLEPQTKE